MDSSPQKPKSIADLIPKHYAPPPKTRATERGDLLKYFTDKLNSTRDGTKFKKLKIPRVAMLLSHLDLSALYYLKSSCEDAERRGNSFSKHFWWSIKPQNI